MSEKRVTTYKGDRKLFSYNFQKLKLFSIRTCLCIRTSLPHTVLRLACDSAEDWLESAQSQPLVLASEDGSSATHTPLL